MSDCPEDRRKPSAVQEAVSGIKGNRNVTVGDILQQSYLKSVSRAFELI